MASQTLSVAVPARVLTQIRKRARKAKHSVEAEIVSLLTDALSADTAPSNCKPAAARQAPPVESNGMPSDEALPADIEAAIAEVEGLNDIDKLREAVVPLMKPKQAKRLESLNRKAQDEGLTDAETRERDELSHLYDKSMIVRATALAELHKRGEDVNKLIAP